MDLEAVKNYLRIDGDAEDDSLQSMLLAAMSYIKGVTGKHFVQKVDGSVGTIEEDAVFCLCVKMLVAQWYENRGEQVQGSMVQVEYAVTEMLRHISLCGEYLSGATEEGRQ